MTTKRTGTVQKWTDAEGNIRWRARLRLGDGSRPWIPLAVGTSEHLAREQSAELQAKEDKHGMLLAARKARRDAAAPIVVVEGQTDGDRWVGAWSQARRDRGLTSTSDNDGHYRHHIRPVFEGKHVRDWTADDGRRLVAALDAKIGQREISAKFAANVWGTATKMVADASRSKTPALRVRNENPFTDVEGPDDGDDREKQYLYPSEFLALVACADVPLRWRRAVALAVYMFPRAGELRSMRWEDVDLEHGTVHVHRAYNRRSRTVKATKSGKGRRFTFEPALVPLLEAMRAEAGGEGLVCPLPNRMADRLRGWLSRAGVTRAELLDATSRTTKPLAFHDLRATGLTWCAVRGDDPLKIMQRAGHEDYATTQIYVRTAEAVKDGFGTVFPPLPAGLLEGTGLADRSTESQVTGIVSLSERDTGFEPATSSLGSWHSTN